MSGGELLFLEDCSVLCVYVMLMVFSCAHLATRECIRYLPPSNTHTLSVPLGITLPCNYH